MNYSHCAFLPVHSVSVHETAVMEARVLFGPFEMNSFWKLLLFPSSKKLGIRVRGAINSELLIQIEKTDRHPQREILSPLGASLDHFLITPPTHFTIQKVRGLVVGFTHQVHKKV